MDLLIDKINTCIEYMDMNDRNRWDEGHTKQNKLSIHMSYKEHDVWKA